MKPKKIAIIGADWPIYEKFCPNFTGMQKGLQTMEIEHKLFSCRPELDVEAVIEYNPDFVIYGLIDMVKNDAWRKRIREGLPDAKIVMWYGDLRNDSTGKLGQIHADMSEIDMMFVSNDAQNEFYKRIWQVPDCKFLPLGSPVYHPPIKKQFELDFVFIGGTFTSDSFLDRAKTMWSFREHGLKIINNNKPTGRAKVFKEMPSIYRSAKISLDYSHFTDIQGYTSNRHWIITGSGGFALTKRYPGCEEFYPPGTRVYFDTFEEALKLKEYYLNHPIAREKIRLAGHIHARNHTYDKRFAIMFEAVYGKDTKNRQKGTRVPTPRT